MPYFRVEAGYPAPSIRVIRPGQERFGIIGGKWTFIKVINDQSLSREGRVYREEKGALAFDVRRHGSHTRQTFIAYLSPDQARAFESAFRFIDSHGLSVKMAKDIYSGLERLARIQTGQTEAAKMTWSRKIRRLVSAGLTEAFTS
ncbi:hypothetical protein M1403_03070 [Patescibacteria group bacterium]|nr:hypothetical protein [Patescibacteria group bacterium]